MLIWELCSSHFDASLDAKRASTPFYLVFRPRCCQQGTFTVLVWIKLCCRSKYLVMWPPLSLSDLLPDQRATLAELSVYSQVMMSCLPQRSGIRFWPPEVSSSNEKSEDDISTALIHGRTSHSNMIAHPRGPLGAIHVLLRNIKCQVSHAGSHPCAAALVIKCAEHVKLGKQGGKNIDAQKCRSANHQDMNVIHYGGLFYRPFIRSIFLA